MAPPDVYCVPHSPHMVNSVNDIFKQARHGSVAAIIQLLNEQLASGDVRTRAMFSGGVLQVLCEATTPDDLDQSTLTRKIRQVLESIGPRGIRRVNINSRIVREQQLLWLDEINRNPEHLLWSEEITLSLPNAFKRIVEDFQEGISKKPESKVMSLQSIREQRQFNRGILGGLGLGVALLLSGWGIYHWLNEQSVETTSMPTSQGNQLPPDQLTATEIPPVLPQPLTPSGQPLNPLSAKPVKTADPFVRAVRLAEKAAIASQTAKTPQEWQAVANMWGEASTLMGQVPASHQRYEMARDRRIVYRENQTSATQKYQ